MGIRLAINSPLARLFELPVEDPEHIEFRDSLWIGGPDLVCSYFFGKYIETNEFNFSFAERQIQFRDFWQRTLPQSAQLVEGRSWIEFLLIWLKHQYRLSIEGRKHPLPKKETKEEIAIVLLLEDPSLSDNTIQSRLKVTEKTIRRWTMFSLLRIELRRLAIAS